MIINVRVCKSRVGGEGGGGGKQNKWVSTGFDPILKRFVWSTRWCLCQSAPFKRDSSLYFCLPRLTLIGYHCQVMRGEVNGGVESTRGHGYMMANLIASLSAL